MIFPIYIHDFDRGIISRFVQFAENIIIIAVASKYAVVQQMVQVFIQRSELVRGVEKEM